MSSYKFPAVFCVACFLITGVPNSLAQEHALSNSQMAAIRELRKKSEQQAFPVAMKLAETAHRVYENMLSDKEDPVLRKKLETEMARIGQKLIALKGESIRQIVAVLTPGQKQLIRTEMRKPGAPADLSELIQKYFKVPEK